MQSYGLDRGSSLLVLLASGCMATFAPSAGDACGGTRCGLKIPVLGDALRKAETARFARAMGTLVANSVPLVQSIGIAGAHLEQPATSRNRWRCRAGREARRRHRGSAAGAPGNFRRWPATC